MTQIPAETQEETREITQEIDQEPDFQKEIENDNSEVELQKESDLDLSEAKNAIKFKFQKKLSKNVMGELCQRECFFLDGVFKCAKSRQSLVEAYLKNNDIKYISEEIQDSFYTLPPSEQKACRLEQAALTTTLKGLSKRIYVRKIIEDYNKFWNANLTLNDFENISQENLPNLLNSEKKDPSGIEHLDIIFKEFNIFKEALEKENNLIEKARDIREAHKKKENGPWGEVEIPFGYVLNNNGVWKEIPPKNTKDKGNEEEEPKLIKICDPVWVAGRSRDYSGSNSGLIIKWIDLDGLIREGCIKRGTIHAKQNTIAEELANNNLFIVYKQENELSHYLSAFTKNKTYRAVKSLGWLENPTGNLIYVSEKHTFRKQNTSIQEEIVFQPDSFCRGASPLECSGTLEEWKEKIGIPCRGNSVPIFLQCTSLSGLIVRYADTGSYGTHISSLTSRGKTTSEQSGASIVGCGADPSYASNLSIIKRWHATANALENLAAQATDSVLALDEIGQCPKSDVDKVIYNLFGGRGKERMNQKAQQRTTRDWCTVVISTGEKSLKETLEETNSKTPAGLFVRFIDLKVEEVFTDYHDEDKKTFVDKLKIDCGLFYGTPGKAFIQNIVDIYNTPHELRDSIAKGCASIAKEISGKAILSQEHARVLKLFCFAAITGIWASEWEIFPYSKEEVLESARDLFEKWHKNNQKQTEDVRCICAIRDFYLKKRDSAFRPRSLSSGEGKRFGDIFGFTTEEEKFFLTEEGLKQALGGLPKKVALKALFLKEYLFKEEDPKRYNSKKGIDGFGIPRVYVISEKISGFDGDLE